MQKTDVLEKKQTVKDFNTFNDIADAELRTWNRCAMAFNVGSSGSLAAMKEYVGQFNQDDYKLIQNMLERVKKEGYDKTRTIIARRINGEAHETTFAA